MLVVDDNQYMRKVIRNLLVNCGVKDIYEAADGIAALDAIRTVAPDVVILDWEMPLLSGAELVRIVRSPGVFPMPDVPIIMLSAHGERWRIIEAVRLGVNEYLIKPVSAQGDLRPPGFDPGRAARRWCRWATITGRSRASCSPSRRGRAPRAGGHAPQCWLTAAAAALSRERIVEPSPACR